MSSTMARRWIPRVCAVVFAGGIAGLIVASINGNNAGVVLTIGLAIGVAAVVLLTYSSVTSRSAIDVFDDAEMERIESQVAALVAAGADETAVRSLVRDALRVGTRAEQR
jgi:hypothetical protein